MAGVELLRFASRSPELRQTERSTGLVTPEMELHGRNDWHQHRTRHPRPFHIEKTEKQQHNKRRNWKETKGHPLPPFPIVRPRG